LVSQGDARNSGKMCKNLLETLMKTRASRRFQIIEYIKVFDLNEEKTKQFAKEMESELNVTVINTRNAEEAIRDSDIVITATMSTFPY